MEYLDSGHIFGRTRKIALALFLRREYVRTRGRCRNVFAGYRCCKLCDTRTTIRNQNIFLRCLHFIFLLSFVLCAILCAPFNHYRST